MDFPQCSPTPHKAKIDPNPSGTAIIYCHFTIAWWRNCSEKFTGTKRKNWRINSSRSSKQIQVTFLDTRASLDSQTNHGFTSTLAFWKQKEKKRPHFSVAVILFEGVPSALLFSSEIRNWRSYFCAATFKLKQVNNRTEYSPSYFFFTSTNSECFAVKIQYHFLCCIWLHWIWENLTRGLG